MKKHLLLLLFSIVLSVPTLFAGEVYFYFQDGEEDDFELEYPSSFVSIWNNTEDQLLQVPQDMGFMSYQASGATMLKIYPNDLEYELTVSVDGSDDYYMLNKEDNEWYLTLLEGADGLEIYVRVYLAGQAPGGSDTPSKINISFNVSAASGSNIDNPGEKVSIGYFDRNLFQDTKVSVTENYGSALVVPGTSFTISPAEGYIVSDITTFSFGVASISNPGDGDVDWFVAVDENPSDSFASFFVTVDKAPDKEPGEEPGKQPDKNAVIKHIEKLQWTVTWEDFDFIAPLDSEYDKNYATLTDKAGKVTILHANLHDIENPTIIFPDYGKYFTLNLEGLNLADGTYTLSIPAKYVTLGQFGISSEPNIAQSLSLTVGEETEKSYSVNFSELYDNYFDISWDNVTSLTEGNTTGSYIQNTLTGEKYDMYFLEGDLYSKANIRIYNNKTLRVVITNNYPNLPSGTYKFYLPANYVKFNRTETGNDAINGYEFTYVRPWSEGNVEFNGPTSDNKLTLTWVDASEILYDSAYTGDGNKIKGVTIFDSTDKQIDVYYADNISINKNVMTIDLNGLQIADGECRVLIPEDCLYVTVDGETDYTYGVAFTFIYGNGSSGSDTPELYTGEATWNIKSGDTVKAGSKVEVGWGDIKLALVDDVERASIHNFNTGILYLEYGSEVYLSEDKTKIVLDLSNMPSGVFRVNVPEACVEFSVNGKTYRNQSTSMDNVILDNTGGIVDITAEDGHYRVVNINGVVILETDNASDLLSLPKGFYIINGKKVIK